MRKDDVSATEKSLFVEMWTHTEWTRIHTVVCSGLAEEFVSESHALVTIFIICGC